MRWKVAGAWSTTPRAGIRGTIRCAQTVHFQRGRNCGEGQPTLHIACAPEDVGWDYETFHGIVSLPVETRS